MWRRGWEGIQTTELNLDSVTLVLMIQQETEEEEARHVLALLRGLRVRCHDHAGQGPGQSYKRQRIPAAEEDGIQPTALEVLALGR